MTYSQTAEARQMALKTYIKLMRATAQVTSRIHQHLHNDNLTQSQFAVLEALYHIGPLSQGELGQKILKSNANLTTVVDSLEKKGLVRRSRPAADRRRVSVCLTPAGEALIAKVFPRHAEIVERELGILSAAELQHLGELLERLGKQKG